MKTLTIDGIYVTASDELSVEELREYVTQMRETYLLMKSMTVTADGDFVNIEVHTACRPFERLRREAAKAGMSLSAYIESRLK